jgi:hypothetical protein
MNIEFQVLMPGFNYDLAHPGRGKSHGWVFFTTYNTEEANSLLEVNASQNDKDFIAAINWKKAEEYIIMNKPCLSLNEVISILNKTNVGSKRRLQLKQLVKSKL